MCLCGVGIASLGIIYPVSALQSCYVRSANCYTNENINKSVWKPKAYYVFSILSEIKIHKKKCKKMWTLNYSPGRNFAEKNSCLDIYESILHKT